VPYHLLFPLFSSVVFVLGMMLAKQAIERGASPWTATFLGNIWIAIAWGAVAVIRQQVAPIETWPSAAVVGLLFVLGQLFTYLAFQKGDVSVAAPVMGIKVLLVAVLRSSMTGDAIPGRVWIAAALATVGIVLVQGSGGVNRSASRWRTILLAGLAALSLSLFDVLLQSWGTNQDCPSFLSLVFVSTAILSLGFLPWCDRPKKLVRIRAMKWMLAGTLLMGLQAMSMTFVLSTFGDAVRVNIVYALRGMWGVVLAWLLARWIGGNEGGLGRRVMLPRLLGAVLLTTAVVVAIGNV
jgi:drug/metabolite transporter (DMT)-like permease